MLRLVTYALATVFVGGQSPLPPVPAPLSIMDSTRSVPTGNYTLGYVNNTVENDCHIGVVKFQSAATAQVSQFSFGAFSQAANETCGIGFVLKSFPSGMQVGTSVSALFRDVAMPAVGTIEMVPFPVPATALWNLTASENYTITIQPFTWASGNTGGTTVAAVHCSFDVPYALVGPTSGLIGYHGPTGLPCGSLPLTVDKAGDGYSLIMKLKGVPVPSGSPTPTTTPTPTSTPTSSQTGTASGTPTPSWTPSVTQTPTQSLSLGSTPSNTPSNTRTPSRTSSISTSATPTPSVTPSATPSPTPSPTTTLSFRATPSVTPTETPGPTDSPSPQPLAGVAAPITIQASSLNTGHVLGSCDWRRACRGCSDWTRCSLAGRFGSAQSPKSKEWKHAPTLEVNNNPIVHRGLTAPFKAHRTSKFETV
jgi:hypothetical protein